MKMRGNTIHPGCQLAIQREDFYRQDAKNAKKEFFTRDRGDDGGKSVYPRISTNQHESNKELNSIRVNSCEFVANFYRQDAENAKEEFLTGENGDNRGKSIHPRIYTNLHESDNNLISIRVNSCQFVDVSSSASLAKRAVKRPGRGFTLIEMITVVSIIVIVLALVIPVVSSGLGNRGVEAGYNRLAGVLAHARQIALYDRATAGVFFYVDPNTGRQDAAYVEQISTLEPRLVQLYESYISSGLAIPTTMSWLKNDTGNATPSYSATNYLEIIPGEEIASLPTGIGVQLITNGSANNTSAATPTDGLVPFGAVLFDSDGFLISTPYSVGRYSNLGGNFGGGSPQPVNMALALDLLNPPPANPPPELYSHVALVLYDMSAYKNQVDPSTSSSFNPLDTINFYKYIGQTNPAPKQLKAQEETWLLGGTNAYTNQSVQQNGIILGIKPDDGSLVRSNQ
jgi:prepilin-type N-terminal cleavage/methylation domain-containing protein